MRIPLLLCVVIFFYSCTRKETQPEIGLQLYSLRNELIADVPGTLDKIKAMGFTIVEGGNTYGYSIDEFKKMLDERQLKMVSLGVSYELLSTDVEQVITTARTFGSESIMCSWIPHHGDTFTIEHAQKAEDMFTKAGKKLSENGLAFYYHVHGYEFRPYKEGTLFDYMVKNTDPRFVNFEMDVFWVKQPGQDPVALLQKYPDRFHMLHLKDRKRGTPDSQDGHAPDETNVVLGTGDVGIAGIMKQAKINGVKYYFIEDESPNAIVQIPKSLDYLKGLSDN